MTHIIYNALQTPDGTVLESHHRYDFKTYTDKNGKEYMVDGGLDYLRRSNQGDEVDLSLDDTAPHDVQREHLTWGTYGKDGKSPLTHKKIAEMETDHIRAVLAECYVSPVRRSCMEKELEQRHDK